MHNKTEIHAYLAGPDVFFDDCIYRGKEKKKKLSEVGIIGHYPLDNFNLEMLSALSKSVQATYIANACENEIRKHSNSKSLFFILANITPFRGISADIGTGFEMGYASALADKNENIIIIGYTEDRRSYKERVYEEYYKGKVSDNIIIEDFDKSDNCMLTYAIEKTGGKVVYSFDEAVELAKSIINERWGRINYEKKNFY